MTETDTKLPDLFDALVEEVGEELEAALPRLAKADSLSTLGRYVMSVGYANLVAQSRHADRQRLKMAPTPALAPKPRTKLAVPFNPKAAAARDELFQSWMLGSTRLGDATKGLLLSEASRETTIADGHHKNAMFYEELAALVPEGSTVAKSVDIRVAHQIRVRVYQKDQRKAA